MFEQGHQLRDLKRLCLQRECNREAAEVIRRGAAKVMIAGGAEACITH